MSQTIERHGAVKFSKPGPQAARLSDAAVFAQPEPDCVDPTWDSIIETVRAFAKLDDDWDGDGAVGPEPELVHMAIELARQLKECSIPAPTRAIAGVNGTISFEFVGDPFTEIEVVSARKADVFEDGKPVRSLLADAEF